MVLTPQLCEETQGVKCCFACQDPLKPMPARKLYPNWKLYPFLKHIWSIIHFSSFIRCDLSVDEQIIGLKVRHVDKMRISHKNNWGGFQADSLYDWAYKYAFFLRKEVVPKGVGLAPLHTCVFYLFITLHNEFHEVHLNNVYMSAKFAHPPYTHHNCVKVQGFCRTSCQGITREVLQTELHYKETSRSGMVSTTI